MAPPKQEVPARAPPTVRSIRKSKRHGGVVGGLPRDAAAAETPPRRGLGVVGDAAALALTVLEHDERADAIVLEAGTELVALLQPRTDRVHFALRGGNGWRGTGSESTTRQPAVTASHARVPEVLPGVSLLACAFEDPRTAHPSAAPPPCCLGRTFARGPALPAVVVPACTSE